MAIINTRLCLRRDTTANWNLKRDFIPLSGEVCIYTDYKRKVNSDETVTLIPGIKIGDGKAYLIDLPFVGTGDVDELL